MLVDAECTHDGSVKHVSKYHSWGWDTMEGRVLDPARLAALDALQRGLLRCACVCVRVCVCVCGGGGGARAPRRNGFRLLREGGTLVYSTCRCAHVDMHSHMRASLNLWISECSLTRAQNEDVVAWLLREEPCAALVPTPFEGEGPAWAPGALPHTVRFDPLRGLTSGLFIARIEKRAAVTGGGGDLGGGGVAVAVHDPLAAV